MKLLQILLISMFGLAATACSDSGSESTLNTDDDGITLETTLLEPGNTISLQSASGDTVDAVATDTDGDGTANGLDFNGDAVIEIEYALSVKTAVRAEDAIAFSFAGDDTVYYFLLIDGVIVMWTSPDAGDTEAVEVTLVTDGDSIIGLNDDGGTEVTIDFDEPIYFGEAATYVSVSPEVETTISGSQTITVILTESVTSADLTGDLGIAANYTLSDAGGKTDDTLVITPDSTWPNGSDLSLVIDAVTVSGNDFTTTTLNYDVDSMGPGVVTSQPLDNGSLGSYADDIYIVFDETITLDNININLNSAGTDYTMSLSTTSIANDTLTLTHNSANWPDTCGENFSFTVEDIYGNSTTINLTSIDIVCV